MSPQNTFNSNPICLIDFKPISFTKTFMYNCFELGWVSLFNGISTYVDYLKQKLFL